MDCHDYLSVKQIYVKIDHREKGLERESRFYLFLQVADFTELSVYFLTI